MKPIFWIWGLCILGLAGCSPGSQASQSAATSVPPVALTVTSPAFALGGAIPVKYTCQGDDSSPALAWSVPPQGTKSLALIMEDPDAPGGTWVHWVVYNLPAGTRGLDETASKANVKTGKMPAGSVQGTSSFGRGDYGGPCPPSGQHHYYFRLYALDTQLTGDALDKAGVVKAMAGHIVAQGEVMGVYQKQ